MNKKLRVCRLDGRQRTKRAVLARLARSLCFPPHFGGNLDALDDALAIDSVGPIRIDWRVTETASRALGADYNEIVDTIKKVAAERSDVELRLTHAGQ